MVDMSILHLADAMASSTRKSLRMHILFTLQRSQPQHIIDISIRANQRCFCNEKCDHHREGGICMAFCFTEVTLAYEQGALWQNDMD